MALADRITALAAAVRDKINLMVPRLIPTGGTTGQVLGKASATNYAMTWVTPQQGVLEARAAVSHGPVQPAAGEYLTAVQNALAVTTVAGAALRCDFVPFIPAFDMTVDQLLCEVTTLLASSTARIGIYDSTSAGLPGTLIAGGTASLDCGTTGSKTEAVSVALTAGTVYWLALATSSTQTMRAGAIGGMLPISIGATGGAFNCRRATLGSMALPSTAPATTLTAATTPLVRLRIATATKPVVETVTITTFTDGATFDAYTPDALELAVLYDA